MFRQPDISIPCPSRDRAGSLERSTSPMSRSKDKVVKLPTSLSWHGHELCYGRSNPGVREVAQDRTGSFRFHHPRSWLSRGGNQALRRACVSRTAGSRPNTGTKPWLLGPRRPFANSSPSKRRSASQFNQVVSAKKASFRLFDNWWVGAEPLSTYRLT